MHTETFGPGIFSQYCASLYFKLSNIFKQELQEIKYKIVTAGQSFLAWMMEI